ncbi:ribonuclease T [Methylopila sp. M107]|uniref:ribonuclease T2 family protein n=1 Tax=Methylopila sp. M107 TaxID=1101190 RepID=UPI0004784D30|nr:ribonuclease T [Methylopila sp. M107]
MRLWSVLAAGLFVLGAAAARAEVPLQGQLLARQDCPALQSIRKATNPGDVRLGPGRSYRLLAKNRPDATHYRVSVDGATPQERWVTVDCGDVAGSDGAGAPDGARPAVRPNSPTSPGASRDGGPSYVFAVSWLSAFCEGLPDKTECVSQTADRYDATHFSLHGLWPQPRSNAYCGVPKQDIAADKAHRWEDLPEPDVTPETRAALAKAMPGVASHLQRHEWTVHGTCFFENSADAYFRREVALIGQLNASPVQKLFADNIGREIGADAIRAAFDQGFGAGAGDRVRVACKRDGDRRIIVELTIGLSGHVGDDASLSTLIAGASPTDRGCSSGTVDPVGLQ